MRNLRLPLATSVVATVRETPTWVFTSRKPSAIAEEILQQKGCKVFRVDDQNGKLDLDEVLKVLAEQGITRLMVEGGPTVGGQLSSPPIWSTRRCCCAPRRPSAPTASTRSRACRSAR